VTGALGNANNRIGHIQTPDQTRGAIRCLRGVQNAVFTFYDGLFVVGCDHPSSIPGIIPKEVEMDIGSKHWFACITPLASKQLFTCDASGQWGKTFSECRKFNGEWVKTFSECRKFSVPHDECLATYINP
jgi:hypothetical protein